MTFSRIIDTRFCIYGKINGISFDRKEINSDLHPSIFGLSGSFLIKKTVIHELYFATQHTQQI